MFDNTYTLQHCKIDPIGTNYHHFYKQRDCFVMFFYASLLLFVEFY